jgi:hypothetical protein
MASFASSARFGKNLPRSNHVGKNKAKKRLENLIFSATIHQLLKHSAHCRPVFSHLLLKRPDYASRSSFAA